MPPRPTRSNTNLPENIADIIDHNIGTRAAMASSSTNPSVSDPLSNPTLASASEPTLLDLLRQMQTSETSMKQSFADLNTRFAQNDDRYTAVMDRLTALESALPGSSSSAPSNTMSAQAYTSIGAPPTGQNPTTARVTEGWNSFHTARQDGRHLPFPPQDARLQESQSGAYMQAPPTEKVLLCRPEHLGEFRGDPTELEDFLGRVHDIARMQPTRAWELAVRAAIPSALKDSAAKWHQGLPDLQVKSMGTLDSYFAAMRRSFPVNYSELRKLAQESRWIPQEETAMAYSFDKVKLLRQVYGPQADERNIVSESLEGLDPSFRAIVRVPRTSMTVDSLREELGDQEPTWRDVHGIRIGDPPRPTSTPSWPRSDGQAYGATNTVLAVAVPDANKTPSRDRPRNRPIPEDFDPIRLGRGIEPKSGKEMMSYRIPDTTRIMWCQRPCRVCGGDHFDFAHNHLTATTASVNLMDVDYCEEYLVTDF